ncbi:MAG: hypothetical protein ACTHJ7_10640, partial [Candidatus Nitrosocosmicus sp.]
GVSIIFFFSLILISLTLIIILFYQKKSHFYLELDSKIHSSKISFKKKKISQHYCIQKDQIVNRGGR